MKLIKYEPKFLPVEWFITRFFEGDNLIFEQETKFPLPTMCTGDNIEIFGQEYLVNKRLFGFNEDAFITVYYIEKPD